MTFSIEVKHRSNNMREKIKSSISQKGKLSESEVIGIKKDVRDMVNLHDDAKQLSKAKSFLFSIIENNSLFFLFCFS